MTAGSPWRQSQPKEGKNLPPTGTGAFPSVSMINRLSELTLPLQVRVKFALALKGQPIVAQGRAKRRQSQAPPWVSELQPRRPRKQACFSAAADRGRNRPGSVDGRMLAHLTPRPSYCCKRRNAHRSNASPFARYLYILNSRRPWTSG